MASEAPGFLARLRGVLRFGGAAKARLGETEKKLAQTRIELDAHEGLLRLAMEDMRKMYEDLLETQSRLLQADKLSAIGLLTAGVVHELVNPLACAQGTVSVLGNFSAAFSKLTGAGAALRKAVETGEKPEEARRLAREFEALERELDAAYLAKNIPELLSLSRQSLESMSRLLQSLRAFSRSDKGVVGPADLNRVLDGVVDIAWIHMKYKARLNKEYSQIPPVRCNAQQIGQVFMNLLVNAAQAVDKDGLVTLKTFREGNEVRVSVRDNGCGIPPEIQKKIFEPFFTTKPADKGTGLGLSICADIVKRHGGRIDVESEPGRWTCFTVSLPAS